MGRALAELKKRLNHRWLQENRPDLDNQKDSRQESLEQDRIQEKYAADEEYIEARELGCPICSHALTTVSASAECPMCEVLWHYHQDDGFSYFEAEVEEIDEYYEVHSPDEIYGEYYSLDEAAEAAERLESKGITIVGIYRFGEEFVEEKEYRAEDRGCYSCPDCGDEMRLRNSPGWGNYCYCIDCKEHYITKPMAMLAAESEDFEAVAVYQGKKPEGSVAKALLQKKLMDKAELLDTIHKLENDVRLGLISEEEIMKQLQEKFGAEELQDIKTVDDMNEMVKNLGSVAYKEFCYRFDIDPEDAQEMSWFIADHYDAPKVISWLMENQDNFDAEFCSECGCSHKDAEEFAAETSGGNQVFNSCWKCGSGQHLYQIARYPATPSEISGVGGNPEEASEGGKRRAGN